MRVADFERELARHGHIPEGATPLPFGSAGRPWYVSAVLGAAGWLASLFAFLFVLLLFEVDTPGAAALSGAVMLGAGLGVYWADRGNAFFEQLALAFLLAGQLALVYAVVEASESASVAAAFTAGMSAALVLVVPNRFAKTLSMFFACIAWALTVRFGLWGEGWFDGARRAVSLTPALVGWLVIWSPIAVGTHALIQREPRWMATDARRTARPALTGLLLALSVGTWASEPFATVTFWMPTGEAPLNWLVLWPFLGVAAALFALVCSFRLRHPAMMGVAIAGSLAHLVQFYYLLGVPLVVKSYVMLATGVVLLLAARRVRLRVAGATTGYAPSGGATP